MTRRIVLAIMAVASAAVVAFGIPLGVVLQRQYRTEAVVKLERQATAATIEVPATSRTTADPIELPDPTDGASLAVYAPDGTRIAGEGPRRADSVVSGANRSQIVDGRSDGDLVVAVPVSAQERVIAVVRASQPAVRLQQRVWRAWAAMAGLAAAVISTAWLLALGLARRLARPVRSLVDTATVLGSGDFSARAPRSGITELDQAAVALDATAERIGAIIERERAFSADASHQLRTPLTAMRMHLHQLKADEDPASLRYRPVEGDVDRLERTIEDLLRLARDASPPRRAIQVHTVLEAVERDWRGPLADRGRRLAVRTADGQPASARVSPAALRQILDVLIDNSLHHGLGQVAVTVRDVAGGHAIDVSDEGTTVIADPDAIFMRRSGDRTGHGIGLALARTLAEAEGARLLLTDTGPGPTFTILFAEGDDDPVAS